MHKHLHLPLRPALRVVCFQAVHSSLVGFRGQYDEAAVLSQLQSGPGCLDWPAVAVPGKGGLGDAAHPHGQVHRVTLCHVRLLGEVHNHWSCDGVSTRHSEGSHARVQWVSAVTQPQGMCTYWRTTTPHTVTGLRPNVVDCHLVHFSQYQASSVTLGWLGVWISHIMHRELRVKRWQHLCMHHHT